MEAAQRQHAKKKDRATCMHMWAAKKWLRVRTWSVASVSACIVGTSLNALPTCAMQRSVGGLASAATAVVGPGWLLSSAYVENRPIARVA